MPTNAPAGNARADLPAMEVRGLHFSYVSNPILKGVDLQIPLGKVTTIMGANGCGKSTLFNLMTKNLEPQRGKIFLRGKSIRNLSLKEFSTRVSIVHQYNSAAADITVGQLVEMGRTPYQKPMGGTSEEDERIVEWALEVTNIADFRDREVSRLSGGQRQRVWIAMALAQNTKVLFLDEPTTYLDIRYQIEILDLVRKLNREYGITIVMVLHDINQALYYSDVIIGLANGRVAVSGAPADVISQGSVRELFGIDLTVTELDGKKYVLLKDEDGCDESRPYEESAGRPAEPDAATEAPAEDRFAEVPFIVPDAANAASASAETLAAMERAAAQPATTRTTFAASMSASDATLAAMRANGFEPDIPEPEPVPEPLVADAAEPAAVERTEPKRSTNRVARLLWTALGVVAFGLGTLGTILPFLPTVPLYLGALFCFAKGSQRLHDWFIGTNLYHKHLESFVDHRGMTMKTKLSIMGTVTVVMAIAFALMGRVPVGRIVLVAVWVFHVIFFIFFVKTDKGKEGVLSDD